MLVVNQYHCFIKIVSRLILTTHLFKNQLRKLQLHSKKFQSPWELLLPYCSFQSLNTLPSNSLKSVFCMLHRGAQICVCFVLQGSIGRGWQPPTFFRLSLHFHFLHDLACCINLFASFHPRTFYCRLLVFSRRFIDF